MMEQSDTHSSETCQERTMALQQFFVKTQNRLYNFWDWEKLHEVNFVLSEYSLKAYVSQEISNWHSLWHSHSAEF